jgi:hypothetical protein
VCVCVSLKDVKHGSKDKQCASMIKQFASVGTGIRIASYAPQKARSHVPHSPIGAQSVHRVSSHHVHWYLQTKTSAV